MSVQGFTLPIIRIQTEEDTNEHQQPSRRKFLTGAAAAATGAQRSASRRSSRRRADFDALAEHLAFEGHLPRVRARLRQEGERHDRRRPQDRGAARGRRGARIRPARRGSPKGTLDGGHGVLVYHYGKQNALALWGSSPAFAMDAKHFACLAQIRRRQGAAQQALRVDRRQCRVLPVRPDADAAARLVQEADTKPDDFKGLKYRTVGISIDLFQGMGAAVNALPGSEIVPAIDRGLLDAAEFNNATSDRLLGFPDVSKVCMLQSYHQNGEQFEITFNKTKYDALPDKIKAIIAYAVEAASADMSWKAIDRYSKDYIELQTKDKVRFYKTPDSVLQKQLEVFDTVNAKNRPRTRCGRKSWNRSAYSRARGALVPRHPGWCAHGLQPLFRQAGGQACTEESLT